MAIAGSAFTWSRQLFWPSLGPWWPDELYSRRPGCLAVISLPNGSAADAAAGATNAAAAAATTAARATAHLNKCGRAPPAAVKSQRARLSRGSLSSQLQWRGHKQPQTVQRPWGVGHAQLCPVQLTSTPTQPAAGSGSSACTPGSGGPAWRTSWAAVWWALHVFLQQLPT